MIHQWMRMILSVQVIWCYPYCAWWFNDHRVLSLVPCVRVLSLVPPCMITMRACAVSRATVHDHHACVCCLSCHCAWSPWVFMWFLNSTSSLTVDTALYISIGVREQPSIPHDLGKWWKLTKHPCASCLLSVSSTTLNSSVVVQLHIFGCVFEAFRWNSPCREGCEGSWFGWNSLHFWVCITFRDSFTKPY